MTAAVRKIGTQRARQAEEWIIRQDGEPLPATDSARLDAWLKEDSRNFGAYVRAAALYRALDYAAAPQSMPVNARFPVSRRMAIAGAAAACGALFVTKRVPPDPLFFVRHAHEAPRRYAWQGNVLILDALSDMDVPQSSRGSVQVLSGRIGVEGTGSGCHLSAGGFSVQTRHADFDLSVHRDGIELVNYGGDVRVSSHGSVMRLDAPAVYRLSLPAEGTPAVARHDSMKDAESLTRRAWRGGQIVLRNTSLVAAASQFMKYSPIVISIDNPVLADQLVTGRFSLLQPYDFARAVQKLFRCGLQATKDRIVLT
ncbi:hypothetical protein HLH36_14055 [Gluconacetobacter aggeris]|uniref:FecR family protein n=1 Tax=Gluconacetobacter aggeris TaxID=1286186 RepID=A0A7W4IUS5_9PROT|nr:hypothetical protein [Gluconacetobacter aggeris]MBB2169460.1 hypothetical protein [Gluconacetobacter aggeris]